MFQQFALKADHLRAIFAEFVVLNKVLVSIARYTAKSNIPNPAVQPQRFSSEYGPDKGAQYVLNFHGTTTVRN
jgi:hypothetical protein